MLMFVFFFCLFVSLSSFCGNTFGCVKKEGSAYLEEPKEFVGAKIVEVSKRIIEEGLVAFDSKKDLERFTMATGLDVSFAGDETLAYEVRVGNILMYKAGSSDSKKREFLDHLDMAALLAVIRSKGLSS